MRIAALYVSGLASLLISGALAIKAWLTPILAQPGLETVGLSKSEMDVMAGETANFAQMHMQTLLTIGAAAFFIGSIIFFCTAAMMSGKE